MRKMLSRVALALALVSAALSAPRAQGAGEGPTAEEQRLARRTAAAFAERLAASRDFGPVVREMFAADFMARYLATQSAWMKGAGATTFMLSGVPALEFDAALAARRDDEHWPRLYVAAVNLMHYTFLSLLARQDIEALADPARTTEAAVLAVYPPEAVRLLEKNRVLANFLSHKGDEVKLSTADDLREAATTLEEVVRLVRPRFDELLAAEAPARLSKNLEMLKEGSGRAEVGLLEETAARAGYPKGTRLLSIFSPLGYNLLLLSEGGRMKILWANLPHD